MNRFYIEKLVVSGGFREESVIEFGPRLNVILGPSNTGKSLILDCLDYVFGAHRGKNHPSKIEYNSGGYSTVTVYLRTDGGTVVISRTIGGTSFEVSGTDMTIDHGTYRVSSTANKSINSLYLKLLGVTEDHKILKSEKGDTSTFTWRSILHLFLMKQADIDREGSPLTAPRSVGKTASPAAVLFLINRKDASDIEKKEDIEITKAKRNALTEYIREKMLTAGNRREELEKQLYGNVQEGEIFYSLDQIYESIDALQQELDKAVSDSRDFMDKIYEQNNKLSECNTLKHQFDILQEQYQTDIRRIEFIVDGKTEIAGLARKQQCPICGTEKEIIYSPDFAYSAAAELDKIKTHLQDLQLVQDDIERQRESIINKIEDLETERDRIEDRISNKLRPRLSEFQVRLEERLVEIRFEGELDAVTRNEEQYREELFEKENEDIPDPPKYNILDEYSYDIVHAYEKQLIDMLVAMNVGGARTARLSLDTFDIEIDGRPKAVSMGGGYCSILNTAIAYSLGTYLLGNNGIAPGFFAADSAMTQLSEADYIEEKNTIKKGFVDYLIENAFSRQMILVEQKESMPYIPEESNNVHIIEFTHDKNSGRYGFLNGMFNPEDE